jgi:phage-related minor tail protein
MNPIAKHQEAAPVLKALLGVAAVWAPVLAALFAGLAPLAAVVFVIAAWAVEWIVAYVVGGSDGESAA